MKQILITAIALLSVLNAYAAGVVVTVTPTKPARCDLKDYTLINSVYELAKEETEKDIKVTFKTSVGTCQKNVIKNFKYAGFQDVILFKEGITLPWSYLPQTEIAKESDSVVKVSLTFDKTKTFKNKSLRKMQFAFKPGYFEGADEVIAKLIEEYYRSNPRAERTLSTFDYTSLQFIWNINLEYNNDKKLTSFVFRGN